MLTKTIAGPLLLVTLLGCSKQGSDMQSAAPQTLEGQIRLAGAEPVIMVMLRPTSGGDEVRLQGMLVEELQRLGGAVVSVSGRMGESAMQGFEVVDYQITSVEGRRPSVGILAAHDGVWWLEGETNVQLTNVPAGLREQQGGKVWVIGNTMDGRVRVESYGVIREP